jgi:hypothetical protein
MRPYVDLAAHLTDVAMRQALERLGDAGEYWLWVNPSARNLGIAMSVRFSGEGCAVRVITSDALLLDEWLLLGAGKAVGSSLIKSINKAAPPPEAPAKKGRKRK